MLESTFTQGGTPKPSNLPLGPFKQQPLPLDRASPTPFLHQYGASDQVPFPSKLTNGRVNHNEETENLTASTARRIFKGGIQSPSPAAAAVEGTLFIETDSVKAVELYRDNKEACEEGGKYLSPEYVSMLLERGYHGLSTRVRVDEEPGRRSSMARLKDKLRDEKSTYGKAVLPLPDMMVSPM